MKISFVIPFRDGLPFTRRCLETLTATLPAGLAHEIILVDDGSTDGTRDWLRTLPGSCRPLLNERNLGYAVACNRGAAAASGEWLGLLNNDLELLPGWLEPLLAGAQRLRRAGVIGNLQLRADTRELDHAGIMIGADGKPAHMRTRPPGDGQPPGYVAMSAVTAACALVPRALFAGLGGFDEGFRNGGEDVDFCFRADAAGHRTWLALASSVLHHVSATPGRKDHDEENSFRLFRRWRPRLEREARRTWCSEFLADVHRGLVPRHRRAERRAALYLRGWRSHPGRWAATNVAQNLLAETVRWERLLPAAPTSAD